MKISMRRNLFIIVCTVFGALILGVGGYNEVGKVLEENFVFAFFGYLLLAGFTLFGAGLGLVLGLLTSFIFIKINRSRRYHPK